jgi:phage shock protein A
VESLGQVGGGAGAFDEFRRMEEKIETAEHTILAQTEVDRALAPPSPSGMSRAEVEAKFRALEIGQSSDPAGPANTEVDDELSALKKKIRIAP